MTIDIVGNAATLAAASGGILSRERIIAQPGFNRWLVPPAALAIHLRIGMAYGFSVEDARERGENIPMMERKSGPRHEFDS
jgi:hypothetical protein